MIAFETLPTSGCFFVRAGDVLSDADLRRYIETVRDLPEAVSQDALYDFRAVERVTGLSVKMVRTLALIRACDRELAARQKVAIVVRSNTLYSMGRMLGSLMARNGPDLRVFRELAPGAEYLGIDMRELDPVAGPR